MNLTELGAQVASMGAKEKQKHGQDLVRGKVNINKYVKGSGVCYDTAAYVRYLLGTKIGIDQLLSKAGADWQNVFNFRSGKQWDGTSSIKEGQAVGFYRLVDKQIFHAAIAIGGTKIRAVNGFRLGAGWLSPVNLRQVLGQPDDSLSFEYDGTRIEVWISKT